ncbi:hypothetical protein fep_094 [Pigeonpox virus]|uniref:Virion core protein n=1 Tax=Pigeonpox virus TaxID=10264 RepID=A0A068EKR9_9POXV|nr:hypothetical protein HM89_gp096 [Pigeonpox virus]AID46602.1 hypothetical protein fep_094 [Pigeonpox virus]WCL40043.1 hypothetical protein [Pigeonpox virus]
MELVNILLESDSERVKLYYDVPPKKSLRTKCEVEKAVKYFISVIKKYIKIKESTFYVVVKDTTLFTYKYDKGNITPVDNTYYTFSKELTSTDYSSSEITSICFTITDDMSISVKPKTGYVVKVRSDNSRYY